MRTVRRQFVNRGLTTAAFIGAGEQPSVGTRHDDAAAPAEQQRLTAVGINNLLDTARHVHGNDVRGVAVVAIVVILPLTARIKQRLRRHGRQ